MKRETMTSQADKPIESTGEPAPTPELVADSEADAAPEAATESATIVEATTAPTSVALTPQQIEELRAKAAKADEHWNRLLRQAADFDNYKKRIARERQDATKYANQALLENLLPVLDHLDAALAAAASGPDDSLASFREGIGMICSQLQGVLAGAGLREIDALHRPFDPNLHEAVSQLESAEAPDGHVLRQLRKGYRLHDRLLRPASVVVAKQPGT